VTYPGSIHGFRFPEMILSMVTERRPSDLSRFDTGVERAIGTGFFSTMSSAGRVRALKSLMPAIHEFEATLVEESFDCARNECSPKEGDCTARIV